jgi:hypothetical protein
MACSLEATKGGLLMNDTLDQHRVLAVLEQKIDSLSRREQTTAAVLAQFRADPFAKNIDHEQVRVAADEEYKRSRLAARDLVTRAMLEHRNILDLLDAASQLHGVHHG